MLNFNLNQINPAPSASSASSSTSSRSRPTPHARRRTATPLSSASTSSLSSLTSLSSDDADSSSSDDQPLASRAVERKRKRAKNASKSHSHASTQSLGTKKVLKPPVGAKKPSRDASAVSCHDSDASLPLPISTSVPNSALATASIPGSSRTIKSKPRKKRRNNANAFCDDDDDGGGWGSSAAELLPSVYRKRSREPSAIACAADEHEEFVRPERVIHTEEDGCVMEKVRSSKTAVEVLTKIGRYKSGMS